MDIRELRIGNSVLHKAEKVKIVTLDADHFDKYISIGVKNEQGDVWIDSPNEIQPIPITEQLLKELGFEETEAPEEGWYFGIEKVLDKGFINDDGEPDFISMVQYEGGLYQLHVLGTLAYVRNLNELESYVYLTTKRDLYEI